MYLSRAQQCIGDWIIYLEPVKAGNKGYHAIAKVEQIVPDPTKPDHYLALMEQGSYLDFEDHVPFSFNGAYPEASVLNEQGRVSGRAQAAVRTIPDADFNRIIDLGLREDETLLPRVPEVSQSPSMLQDIRTPFQFDFERDRAAYWTSRPKRDRIFRKLVLDAYDSRCALTGFKFINGGGRAEVEAAHIKPVEHQGPDSIHNGLPLCGTVHWMFDRGLISLSDDLDILVSRHVNDADSVWSLVNKTRKAILPNPASSRPHPRFLTWHRENCFKQ